MATGSIKLLLRNTDLSVEYFFAFLKHFAMKGLDSGLASMASARHCEKKETRGVELKET